MNDRVPALRVTELPAALEPVGRDPFIDGLPGGDDWRAMDAHERQVALVRASLMTRDEDAA
jgi:hypothetical protein